jgi:hypothetical protein
MIEKNSSSGMRVVCFRWRLVITTESLTAYERLMSPPSSKA